MPTKALARCVTELHDGVIKWKHFPRYWPFVRGIHRSPVNSPHKGQWRGALMFSLICVSISNGVTVMYRGECTSKKWPSSQQVTNRFEHDDVIKWKHVPRYWPFVRGIPRSPVNSPHKGQWRGALMFSLICTRINGWAYNREAGDLRRYRAHYNVIVMPLRASSLHGPNLSPLCLQISKHLTRIGHQPLQCWLKG